MDQETERHKLYTPRHTSYAWGIINILLSKKGLKNQYTVLIQSKNVASDSSFLVLEPDKKWNDFLLYIWINVPNINSEIC